MTVLDAEVEAVLHGEREVGHLAECALHLVRVRVRVRV